MALDVVNTGNLDAGSNIKVALSQDPDYTGGVRLFSENDTGTVTGDPYLQSPETDDDFRLRIAQECVLDEETFNYTAQNTGKAAYRNTAMTIGWIVNGMSLNSGTITTIGSGVSYSTYAYHTMHGLASTYLKMSASFNVSTFPTNTTLDFGFFLANTSNPYNPTDGVYFRVTSAGLFGVINFNGTETINGPFAASFGGSNWAPTIGEKYGFLIAVSEAYVEFWIDDVLMGEIQTPLSQGQPFQAASLPVSARMAIGGTAASAGMQFLVSDYTVSVGGPNTTDRLSVIGNRIFGSYQGLSGGTMGSLATYANSTNPTPSAGSNTSSNVSGLGGQGAINAAVAAATDFIMCAYQNPAGTVSVQGRRLVVRGVKISCVNMGAAVATTATTIALSLCFGQTAGALNTAEGATTKAPRRLALGFMYWNVGAPIGATPQNGDIYMNFDSPVYVNPGEFVSTAMKFIVGTATASQSIWYHVTFDYGWE